MRCAVCLGVLVSCIGTARATTYVVDGARGNDAAVGSSTDPWRTIGASLPRLLAGDVLEVRAGTYREELVFDLTANAQSPIVIRAVAGATVVIDGGGTLPADPEQALVVVAGSHTTFQGFEVKGSNGQGVLVNGEANAVVGCKVHHNAHRGIFLTTGRSAAARDNVVYQNGLANEKAHTLSTGEAGIGVFQADQAVVSGNTVYNNHVAGVVISESSGALVERNTLYDSLDHGNYLDRASRVTFTRNFVYCTGAAAWQVGNLRPNGLAIGDGPHSEGHVVTNNIFSGCQNNLIWFRGDETPGVTIGLRGALIANNTFSQAQGVALQLDAGPHPGTRIINNIVIQSNASVLELTEPSTGLSFASNNWFGGGPPKEGESKDDILVSCQLPNITALNPVGFRLPASSPCRDKGTPEAGVAVDYFGTKRPYGARIDVGAHEFDGTNVIGDGGIVFADGGAPTADGGPRDGTTGPAGDGTISTQPGGCSCAVKDSASAAQAAGALALSLLVGLVTGLARARRRRAD